MDALAGETFRDWTSLGAERLRKIVPGTMPLLPGLIVLRASRDPKGYRAVVRLEPDSPLLSGHFPGHPILPGIAHLGIGLHGVDELLGREHSLVAVRDVRFRRAARPEDLIELAVVGAAEPGSFRFELRAADEVMSRGLLVVKDDVRT